MRERESRSSKVDHHHQQQQNLDQQAKNHEKETGGFASEFLLTSFIVFHALLLRWCVSYHPYSGAGTPPMFGDYEAQRHWQEITLNLPISQWYSNSTDNDLQYWGLDYPPITAYHSYLLAKVAEIFDPDSVKLHQSRGHESSTHKYFMRLSVLAIDLLIFIPVIIYFAFAILPILDCKNKKQLEKVEKREFLWFKKKHYFLATVLFYPGLILIDYGHFQYNCVSLGLFIVSVSALFQGSMAISSFFFVLALNYKQMELYHALPCFFYILGINMPGKRKPLLTCLRSLICVSLTVIVTFGLIWAPFLTDRKVFMDTVLRLFPLTRGIFEDKVANVWCAINVIYKLRNNFTNLQLAQICLVSTTAALLPSSLDLFFRPSREKFLLALINSSLSFFLFSFQVHEKSILLVSLPVLLHFIKDPLPCFWFLIISVFSMLPLLIKDGLYTAYFATLIFFIVSVYCMWFESKISDLIKTKTEKQEEKSTLKKVKVKKNPITLSNNDIYINILYGISILGVLILSLCAKFLKAPKKYPDLYSLLISIYSCGHFVVFLIYFNYKQFYATTVPARKYKVK
ncbi:probable dolichyl pyrophosphate Man9GlcNAc2 alpha-1,3-glucosyltransferase [Trichogramma pretiosum]|uniref:probable dolichyl pyrophosphate Man9GlcNAc2 alpha-1,3-glucosyltransferase n=1 Tax=Trichogramma pretiosum TaxID=7493 RepID=UPI0006C95883|nr:probable dolichyl pyrophosphate Man9GlcNAc2 alpha-1,3-glucosyltransferase [Trichogramma pretiosum]